MKGRIHSFQSLGAVDGPGLRFVVFMQGCTMRCAYCHNPDTWNIASGEEYEVQEVVQRILRYKPYFGSDGGVTVSGGEPLLQWEFVAELFRALHSEGIHTALDTAGIGHLDGARSVLLNTDLVLCDVKFSSGEEYHAYCRGNRNTVLAFLKLAQSLNVPLWVRHVVVPGLNDNEESILQVASLAAQFSNVRKMELLPFRKICISKYENLGIPFPLAAYEEETDSEIARLYRLIQDSGFHFPQQEN